MAYDPNDAADKAIFDAAIAEATTALKAKNSELIGEVRDLRAKGGGDNLAKVERLEGQLATAQEKLSEATAKTTTLERDLGKATKTAETASQRADRLVVSNSVKDALTSAKIAPQFHKAVEAMFVKDAVVKDDSVLIGDKPLTEVISAFAQSDEGKHFVAAPANSGGGSQGSGNANAKAITRTQLDAMPQADRHAFFKDGGTVTDT